MASLHTPEEIIRFWFSDNVRPLWFASTPEFDRALTKEYLTTYQAAAKGQLEEWRANPEGALALIIALDQFPLNMFRGRPESFMTEAQAREVATEAVNKGFNERLTKAQRVFMYLPFMHSETLADQDRSVALFEKDGNDNGLHYARHHRDLIRRFGRFPHRNAILGRNSTQEELDYLNSEEAFLG